MSLCARGPASTSAPREPREALSPSVVAARPEATLLLFVSLGVAVVVRERAAVERRGGRGCGCGVGGSSASAPREPLAALAPSVVAACPEPTLPVSAGVGDVPHAEHLVLFGRSEHSEATAPQTSHFQWARQCEQK